MTAASERVAPLHDAPASLTGLTRVCRLAEGGMGRVDLAMRHVGGFRRLYAIKRLHPHFASDPEFRTMFLDEARIAGRIRHANVVGVLDVGEDDHGPFLVMDYVDGLPLSNLVRLAAATGEPMPVQICVRIALDVARGLHAAHELTVEGRALGLVHRDLSPQNVLVGFDGVSRITDFGIAKAFGRSTRTATGVMKGKLAYMSPEQIRLEVPDRRSDLFALGIVLFEMLSGERLYGGVTAAEILEAPPPDIGELRADVPDELVRLLFELLAHDRDARPPDAREVGRRLESVYARLVTEEDPADVADYALFVAGDARAEQERVLAAAVEEAERALARKESARIGARGWIAGGAAVAIAAGAAWALAWPRAEDATRAMESAAMPPAAPAGAEAPGEPDPLAPDASRAAPGEPGGRIDEASARRANRHARRRRALMRRRAMEAATETAMDDERMPDWVEFER